jgi:ABC-type transporter Mla subunit MlaD
MKPADLLDPSQFPDDLKWVAAHHRLHPTDPVYLLVAWHWRRVQQSEDTLKAAIVELKAALDTRLGAITEAAESVTAVSEALAGVQDALEEKPAQLGEQLDAKLNQPLAHALAEIHALEKSLAPLARTFRTVQHRQLLATLLIGVTLGVLSAVIVLLA